MKVVCVGEKAFLPVHLCQSRMPVSNRTRVQSLENVLTDFPSSSSRARAHTPTSQIHKKLNPHLLLCTQSTKISPMIKRQNEQRTRKKDQKKKSWTIYTWVVLKKKKRKLFFYDKILVNVSKERKKLMKQVLS